MAAFAQPVGTVGVVPSGSSQLDDLDQKVREQAAELDKIQKRFTQVAEPTEEAARDQDYSNGEINYLLEKLKVAKVMTRDPITISPDALLEEAAVLMRDHKIEMLPVMEAVQEWTEEALHGGLMAAIEASGMKTGQVLWPLRVAISGQASTPGGAIEIAYLLGREETLSRLRQSIASLGGA